MANGNQDTPQDTTDAEQRAASFLRQQGAIDEPDPELRAREFLQQQGATEDPEINTRAQQFLQQQGFGQQEQDGADIETPDLVNRARQFLQGSGSTPSRPRPEEGMGDIEVPDLDDEEREAVDQQLQRRINVLRDREHQLTDQVKGLRDSAKTELSGAGVRGPRTFNDPELSAKADSVESERDKIRDQRLNLLEQRDEIRDEDKGFWEQSWEALTSSTLSIQQMPSIFNVQENVDMVRDLERIDNGELQIQGSELTSTRRGMADERTRELFKYQTMDDENRQEYKRNLGREMVGNLVRAENLQDKISQIQGDPVVEEMLQAKTNEEGLEIFMQSPIESTMALGFTSLPYMAPSLALGAVGASVAGPGGAAAGIGIGSGMMEYSADMSQRILMEAHERTGINSDDIMAEMEEQGIDTEEVSPQSLFFGKDSYKIPELLRESGEDSEFKRSLVEVVGDRELMKRFNNQAALKASGVALGDAAGAFIPAHTITSRFMMRAAGSQAGSIPNIAGSMATGMLVDASSGGAGEALGQMLAEGEVKPGEVQAEFFGEFFGSPVQIGTTVAGSVQQRRASDAHRQRIQDAVNRARAREEGAPTEGRPFRYIELTEEPTQGPQEERAFQWVLNNLDQMDQNYNENVLEEFDIEESKVVSGDEAKKSIPGFTPEMSGIYHEPASGFAKLKFGDLLQDEGTQDQPVLMLSGGAGAGKTSSLRITNVDLDEFAATYDTNLSSFRSAKTKVDQALESGRDVEIVHTFREPVESFVNGVIPRVASEGRIVPIDAHVHTHLGARETLIQLAEEYGDNEAVTIGAIDNSRGVDENGTPNSTPVPLDQLPEINYTEESLTEALTQAVDDARQQGQITPQEAATFKGQNRQDAAPLAQQGANQGALRVAEQPQDQFVEPPIAATADQAVPPHVARNRIETFRRKQRQAIPEDENFLEKVRNKIWPFDSSTTTDQASAATNLIRQRAGDIGTGKLDSFEFRNRISQRHNDTELQAITFMLEETDAPQGIANREEIQALINQPTEQMEQTTQEVREYLNEAHEFLMDTMGEDVGFIENYVPHIWDIPNNRMDEIVNWFVTENPSTKKRLIPTIKKGIEEMGLKPQSLNIERLLSIYDEFKIKTAANVQFVEGLVEMTDEYGEPLVKRTDEAPANWIEIDHPVLRRGMAVANNDEQVVILKVPVKVHPEIAQATRAVLGQPFNNKWIKGILNINAFLKKSWLTLSFFHPAALTEVGFATPGMAKNTAKIAGQFLRPKQLFKKISENDYDYLENLDVAKDGVRHGLQLGAIDDVHRDQVSQMLESIEQKFADGPLSLFRKGATALRKGNEKWDKALWDYVHNSLKIQAYESLVAYNMRNFPDADVETIKLETAQQVNDTFGGQNWELLLKSPKFKQLSQLVLLSPDWTWSTSRQFASMLGIGDVTGTETGTALRKKMGRAFWARATLFFLGGVNVLNWTLTKGKYGDGRFLWQNDPGEKTNLEICNYPDGTKKYLRWGKQFREVFEFIEKPIEKISAKFSPVIQEGAKQVTGQSLTGFPTEFQDQSFWESVLPRKGNLLPDRFEELARSPIPFSIKNQIRNGEIEPLNMAFPISRGLTPYSTRQFFEQAINRRDASYISEIARNAAENNLNPTELLTQTVAQMQSNRKQELRREYGVRDFEDLPPSVQIGYENWRRQIKAYQAQVEHVVAPFENQSSN